MRNDYPLHQQKKKLQGLVKKVLHLFNQKTYLAYWNLLIVRDLWQAYY